MPENLPFRRYYSARTGRSSVHQFDLKTLKELFVSLWTHFQNVGNFDEYFGSFCIDTGNLPGVIGFNVSDYVVLRLRRKGLWPIVDNVDKWTEEDLFDMIEFLFDHTSKPTEGNYHNYADCGYHWTKFDHLAGRAEYRERMSPLLEGYGQGFILNPDGEIEGMPPEGMARLLEAPLPTKDVTVQERVQSAVARFQRYRSSADDRQNAVRDLADVLEWLRPQIKTALLKEDESDLFKIANNFGIRHLNQKQKTSYDKAVWLSWMFYHYLATINAALHMIERQEREEGGR